MAFSSFKTTNKNKADLQKKEEGVFVESENRGKVANTTLTSKTGLRWDLVKYPWFTEKALRETSQNKYVFKVASYANKPEIKKLIERGYNVKVLSVHMVTIPGKSFGRGVRKGEKSGYKKAIVTLKKGSTLEVATQ